VRLLSALAGLGFQPEPPTRALLLEAAGAELPAFATHQLSSLAWALTQLGWRVRRSQGSWGPLAPSQGPAGMKAQGRQGEEWGGMCGEGWRVRRTGGSDKCVSSGRGW
jgi:hypothetical protein